ncbi:hypothetical protein LY76DRAFT_201854 [Colletotrichum caudatum]|nr:hypothetical protein LY76DRAFT_201854 [Colletotrichum caudatum]
MGFRYPIALSSLVSVGTHAYTRLTHTDGIPIDVRTTSLACHRHRRPPVGSIFGRSYPSHLVQHPRDTPPPLQRLLRLDIDVSSLPSKLNCPLTRLAAALPPDVDLLLH